MKLLAFSFRVSTAAFDFQLVFGKHFLFIFPFFFFANLVTFLGIFPLEVNLTQRDYSGLHILFTIITARVPECFSAEKKSLETCSNMGFWLKKMIFLGTFYRKTTLQRFKVAMNLSHLTHVSSRWLQLSVRKKR